MSLVMAISLSVGLLSGLWAFISSSLGLLTWVGFIGCTSYYASGGKKDGLKKSVMANMTGVLWAMSIILLSKYIGGSYTGAIMTGIFSFVMCIQSKIKLLAFIPGTFCGSCAVFGANGDWKAVIIALLCGAILGYSSDMGGIALHKFLNKTTKVEKESYNN